MNLYKIAIIGAGASGLMCADYLAGLQLPNVSIQIFEQMPSAGRKLLWAGKTGLNISHAEPIDRFVGRYMPADWLSPYIRQYDAIWLQDWAKDLGIETFVGSTGRIFPTTMKASPLLRAWLTRLAKQGVEIFYRHKCLNINKNTLTLERQSKDGSEQFTQSFDVIILACGGMSYPRLGSTGEWQTWLNHNEMTPMYASNVGICRQWSAFIQPYFGNPLKRVTAWVGDGQKIHGDIIISHYGLEGGVIYQLNHALRQSTNNNKLVLTLDLLPDVSNEKLLSLLTKPKKSSLTTLWQKAGLDKTKIALLRECTNKSDWHNPQTMTQLIKNLPIVFDGFRPIEEAISSGGGIKQSALQNFQLKSNPYVFCCGEMLDWDAPTGGYLLTACFATGRACGEQVTQFLQIK